MIEIKLALQKKNFINKIRVLLIFVFNNKKSQKMKN